MFYHMNTMISLTVYLLISIVGGPYVDVQRQSVKVMKQTHRYYCYYYTLQDQQLSLLNMEPRPKHKLLQNPTPINCAAIFFALHNFVFKGHLKCWCMGFVHINVLLPGSHTTDYLSIIFVLPFK